MSPSARIHVIAGGLSAERDVSLRSGRRLAESLRLSGFDVVVRDLDANLLPDLVSDPPDMAIPLVHGIAGEDGSLQDVLDLYGLPFIGSTSLACRTAFNKATAKGLVAASGLAVPRGYALPQETFRDLGAPALMRALEQDLGLPLMVKPVRGGSSLGAMRVSESAQLAPALVGAFAYGDSALIEEYITGTEISVSVVDLGDGPQAWPAVEIAPRSGIYDYAARYTAGETEFFTPARISDDLAETAARAAVTAFSTLSLRDWARVDFIVADSTVHFLEVNVAPGMTETSMFPLAAAAAGVTLGEVAARLIQRRSGR